MAWVTLKSRDGIYLVDWGTVGRIIRSYARSKAMLKNSQINEETHWIGPNLHTLDVNWDQVRSDTDAEGECLLSMIYRGAQGRTRNQIAQLANWIEVTKHNNARFQKKMRDAQKKTMENIDKSVDRAQVGLEIAKVTRDLSAEFLMVSATIVSGGTVATVAAAGGLVGGSALKATAKWEDDPNATRGAIAATFTTELAVGMLDLGAGKMIEHAAAKAGEKALSMAIGSSALRKAAEEAAKRGTKTGLAILWVNAKGLTLEPGKAVIQGGSIQQGVLTGSLKTVGGIHGELLKLLVINDDKYAKTAAFADTLISYGADKASEYLAEKNKNEKAERPGATEPPPETPDAEDSQQALLDALAHDYEMIDQVAIHQIGSIDSSLSSQRFHGQQLLRRN